MKMRKLMATLGIGVLALTGCSATSETVENKSQGELASNENTGGQSTSESLRIVSATVSATQVLDQLDADLVGVPQTKYELPKRYDGLTLVGQAMKPDFEAIVALDSDLVIIDAMFKENVEKSVEAYGLEAFYFNTSTYSNFVTSIEELGKKIGKAEEAENFVGTLRDVEEAVREQAEGEAPTVAVLFGGGENFMLATDHSYLGDLVHTVGANNMTDDLNIDSEYIPFSLEQIVAADPDYILRFAHGELEATKKAFDQAFEKNPAFATLTAVKEGRVIDLDPNIFGVSANIYIVEAINELGELFYGK